MECHMLEISYEVNVHMFWNAYVQEFICNLFHMFKIAYEKLHICPFPICKTKHILYK